jgi:TonB family protein
MTYNLGTIETGDMNEEWKQWEGRTVDGIFPLNRYFGGSDHSAVFQTNRQSGAGESESAAIKLVPADASDGEKQLARWRAARELDHPNLIRVFAAGRSEVDGAEVLYVVEEYAEENLAQILPERALTAEEARMMLPPVLSALQYVHGRGLVHGRIQPSNILAIGDQVKLSSDSLGAPGETTGTPDAYDPPEAGTGARSAAGDVWRLGMTLVEVLTQRLPERDRSKAGAPDIPLEVPEPFREIAARCLQVDPEKRWTIAEIAARLETGQAERAATPSQTHAMAAVPLLPGRESLGGEHPPQANKSAKWPYVLLLVVVVVVILFLMTRAKTTGTPNGTSAEGVQSSATQAGSSPTSPGAQGAGDGVLKRVMPEISPSARRTIRGTIVIRVTVHVDAAGEVTTAKIESGRASKYFSREALEAAREWKFASAPDGTGTREWKVQFRFSRVRTEASAARVKG